MDDFSNHKATSSSKSGDNPLRRRPLNPEEYIVRDFKGRLYIVPKFLNLSTEAATAAIEERDKLDMEVDDVSVFSNEQFNAD